MHGHSRGHGLSEDCCHAAVSHMLRDLGARRPGTVTRIGLGTFVDPRQSGGAANKLTASQAPPRVELVELPGSKEEALWWVTGSQQPWTMKHAATNQQCMQL